jgi:predicted flap endonuclease-1-like 5' DNA nuclease
MSEVAWQAVFMLAAAFFFGAVIGCGLKRRFWYGRKSAAGAAAATVTPAAIKADASQPKIEVASRPGDTGPRFERTLSVSSATPAAAPAKATPAVSQPQPAKAGPAAPPVQAPAPRAAPSASAAPLKVEDGGAGPSDDLTRIRGIDPILQRRLKDLGIRRFEEVARLTPADIKGLNETLDLKGRIDEENWLGQAHILATGGETYYSRRRDRGVPMPDAVSPAAAVPAMEAPKPPAPRPAAAPAAAVEPPKQPAPSPAPAPRAPPAAAPAVSAAQSSAPSDVSYLRSVRSEALRGEGGAPDGDIDDLKRIRGIGILIEKKLNSLGITQYEQVANWTGADIERISRLLDFKGRIEREHWIEQARILATGGQTEFSRRS